MREGDRGNEDRGDKTRENSRKAPLLIQETMAAEIRDHPDHHHKEMTLNQVTTVQIMVAEDVEDKAPHGDQNVLIPLTLK